MILRKLLLIPFLFALAVPAVRAADEARVGYVNVQYLVDNSPQATAASSDLEQKFGPQQRELQKQKQEFERLQQKLQKDGLVMSENERADVEQQLRELKREIERGQKDLREELNIQRNDILSRIQDSVMKSVQDLAKDEGYDLIVGQGALYASDAVNLTDKVLARMKEQFNAEQSE
jgi:outer membrane protein